MRVLAIDYSTTRAGFVVISSAGIIFAKSIELSKKGNHKQRREIMRKAVQTLVDRYKVQFIVIERVRLFHRGNIRLDTIKRLAQMTSTIIDATDTQVFDVDVRSWKKQILGSAKANKEDSVSYVKKKYKIEKNHDICDAVCFGELALRDKKFKYLKPVV